MGWFSKPEKPVVNPVQSALLRAAQNLNVFGLREALSKGADPSGGADASISPLVASMVTVQAWALNSSSKQQEIVFALLDAGAKPEYGGRDGQGPLEIALRNGWLPVVNKLLEKGHDPNRINHSGPTPLQLLMSSGEYKGWELLPFVDALLSAGANALASNRQQAVPLILGMRNEKIRYAPDLEASLEALVDAGGVPRDEAESLATLALELHWESLAEAITASHAAMEAAASSDEALDSKPLQ